LSSVTYFSLYLLLCWSVIAANTWRLFPGATALVGAAAIYSAAPIFLFIRRLRWSFYPGALFRVFVVRMLLYTQLTLPFVTVAVLLNTVAIALAHNPTLFPSLAGRGVALTLSGHSHWGQFAIPKRGWSLASRVLQSAIGTYQIRDSLLYVSPDTGSWGIPFRIGALPEITVITLRSAAVAGIAMSESKRAHQRLK